jgi:hypothetical protein
MQFEPIAKDGDGFTQLEMGFNINLDELIND